MKKDFFQNVCGTKVFTLMLAALACMAVTACGSDDDEENGSDEITSDELPASTAVELPIPLSVIDGVRVTGIGTDGGDAAASVTYNDDGSIDKAVFGGNEYSFEYEDTRAFSASVTGTGRKLKYIRLRRTTYSDGGDDSQSYEDIAYNFKFNSQGFLSSCDEMMRYRRSNNDVYLYWEKEDQKLSSKMTYNADGRLDNISISYDGTYGDSYNGYEVTKGSAESSYSYTDNNLTALTMKSSDSDGTGSVSAVPSYTGAIENKYNIITIEMAEAMVPYSPIMEIMGILGYLGNAGTTLPTKLVITDIETDEDGTTRSVTTSNISYTFLSDNKINTVSVTGNNDYTYKYLWTK